MSTLARSNTIRRQGRYWLCTIPRNDWDPHLPALCSYIKGQAEIGNETSYEHWQILVVTKKKVGIAALKRLLGGENNGQSIHGELSRSDAANEYVWKEDTRIDGTQFELGLKD